jgi:hypothetical protein
VKEEADVAWNVSGQTLSWQHPSSMTAGITTAAPSSMTSMSWQHPSSMTAGITTTASASAAVGGNDMRAHAAGSQRSGGRDVRVSHLQQDEHDDSHYGEDDDTSDQAQHGETFLLPTHAPASAPLDVEEPEQPMVPIFVSPLFTSPPTPDGGEGKLGSEMRGMDEEEVAKKEKEVPQQHTEEATEEAVLFEMILDLEADEIVGREEQFKAMLIQDVSNSVAERCLKFAVKTCIII